MNFPTASYLPLRAYTLIIAALVIGLFSSCGDSSHQQMIKILTELRVRNNSRLNFNDPAPQLVKIDSEIRASANQGDINFYNYVKASLLVKLGREQEAVTIYENLLDRLDPAISAQMLPEAAIACVRLGERNNCMLNHTGSSCVFPIQERGVHTIQTGSQKAIKLYEQILKDSVNDLESRWLLNIAFMTLGGYPKNVPAKLLIPNLDVDTGYKVNPFTDAASALKLTVDNKAGGVIVDDFNGDGYMDIMTSGMGLDDEMHYFQNNQDGTFSDRTAQSGLKGITGGLNIQQTDYNNDGRPDVFVLRGAWLEKGFGNQPSSLLRNNGDGTFTDVTTNVGLLYCHSTQTAVWADFNGDGWLDVFIGYESKSPDDIEKCALYINDHGKGFTNVAQQAHCDMDGFIKGVTSADYNNDGKPDLFISGIDGKKFLLKNITKPGKAIDFENVTDKAGFAGDNRPTFATWFFDYNNDGWPDIIADNFDFKSYSTTLGYFAAAEALGKPVKGAGNIFLYRNNKDGTFTNVTEEVGLNKVVFAMGANFGDIDNDGYPDMYFGTGNPDFRSLVPNKLFKNMGGKRFADVTKSARVGNLQKGHGVAFADFRNIGRQDIYIDMGGTYSGDAYANSLYLNPGQGTNNWISLKLEGVTANKAAIGSHIKVTFTENGIKRSVYHDVNSGGSFGSSPLQQEIGIGQAKIIDEIAIQWAGSQKTQFFRNITPNQFLHIAEGDNVAHPIHLKQLNFRGVSNTICYPLVAQVKNK
ncbi:CRTAC1 family protein [Mucilaginibacter sp. BJC16-A38]|uniref:CRTAC1 family protein n=1 Tax=Mucilaginibacter phenanthrenivorans TaxID=1234842 RepID=UPI0021585512|nr:CRTAC1 family protein [Mucilaginibacter phenanthrenivorans]MCR8558867.1 CRTAC1 family protein [Mucilaginibacter phenanthrenivorans]